MKYPYEQPGIYAIHIAGRLDASWSECLGGMAITYEEGDGQDNQEITVLHGCLPDQAALFGVLHALYNARYPLLFVRYIKSGESVQLPS